MEEDNQAPRSCKKQLVHLGRNPARDLGLTSELKSALSFRQRLFRRRPFFTPLVSDLATPLSECDPLTLLRAFKDAGACYSPKSCKLRSEPQLLPDVYFFKARSNGQWPYYQVG